MKTDDTMLSEITALRAMDTAALIAKYAEVFGKAPRVRNRESLWKRISWKLQEARSGGLSESAKSRLEQLIGEIDLPLGESRRSVSGVITPTRAARNDQLAIGSTITRVWKGRTLEVRVIDAGFEWNGVPYRSLSAVAHAVTGAHWNGKLFFGLTGRKSHK